MKKIIAFAALAVLVSSCGNKMTLMKRHYTKGYYHHHSSEVKQHDQVLTDKVKADKMPTIKTYVSDEKKDLSVVAFVKDAAAEKSNEKKSLQSNLAKKVNEVNPVVTKTQNFYLKQEHRALKESANAKGGGDANAVIEAILCIFIPPLAVFIHEDSITSHFWIDLLLCFLFFLPGIIYAFVICFA